MAFRILSDPDDDPEQDSQEDEPRDSAYARRVDLAMDELRDGLWEETL